MLRPQDAARSGLPALGRRGAAIPGGQWLGHGHQGFRQPAFRPQGPAERSRPAQAPVVCGRALDRLAERPDHRGGADLAAAAAAACTERKRPGLSGHSASLAASPAPGKRSCTRQPQQVLDPATGKPIARVPNCGGAETRQAIAAAEIQFKEWGQRPGKERATILRRWQRLAGGWHWLLVCGSRKLAIRAAAASSALCLESAAALRCLGTWHTSA